LPEKNLRKIWGRKNISGGKFNLNLLVGDIFRNIFNENLFMEIFLKVRKITT
jgi:hypothetical protein